MRPVVVLVSVVVGWGVAEGAGAGDAFVSDLSTLHRLKAAQSRSISPESFTGAKGAAGMATNGTGANAARDLGRGWKVSPSVSIPAGTTFTLAEIDGPGAIQQIWMTPAPTDRTRHRILPLSLDRHRGNTPQQDDMSFILLSLGPASEAREARKAG